MATRPTASRPRDARVEASLSGRFTEFGDAGQRGGLACPLQLFVAAVFGLFIAHSFGGIPMSLSPKPARNRPRDAPSSVSKFGLPSRNAGVESGAECHRARFVLPVSQSGSGASVRVGGVPGFGPRRGTARA